MMKAENELPEESEKFSDDPEENLRMQNDFLKMKMMAESGAVFGGDGNLSPDIENEFLKNIMEFEKGYANAKPQKIVEVLGNPVFEDEQNLDDEQLAQEFERLNKLLNDHNINIGFIAERADRLKYDFITKELLEHEASFMPVKGMTTNYIYEEFHPDHKLDITETTERFLNDFIDRKLDEDTYYINKEIIEPDGKIVAREEMIKRFQAMYEAVVEFDNFSFNIENINFELKEENENCSGMGFSEGEINYDIVFQGGERKEIKGPFKIYFAREWDCWGICFFYIAGFNLHTK